MIFGTLKYQVSSINLDTSKSANRYLQILILSHIFSLNKQYPSMINPSSLTPHSYDKFIT